MAVVYITRKAHFSAAHRLHSDLLDDKQNEKLYGLCNNPYGHGHNYDLEITIKGEPDPVTGMVMDLKDLKDIINKEVVDKMDHKHLNFDVDFMKGIVPTAENIAVVIWNRLKEKIKGGELFEVKLYETPRNIAIYRGE